jgi:Holliday junction resolvase RusA-like endonuclease
MPDAGRITLDNIVVVGTPRAKGSYVPIKRKDGGVFMKSSAKVVSWQGCVRDAALIATSKMEGFVFPWAGPVELYLDLFYERPKNHHRSGKYSSELRNDAPAFMTRPPDIDKVERAILDALTGVLFLDDAQVVCVRKWKRWAGYAEPPRAIITPIIYVDVKGTDE